MSIKVYSPTLTALNTYGIRETLKYYDHIISDYINRMHEVLNRVEPCGDAGGPELYILKGLLLSVLLYGTYKYDQSEPTNDYKYNLGAIILSYSKKSEALTNRKRTVNVLTSVVGKNSLSYSENGVSYRFEYEDSNPVNNWVDVFNRYIFFESSHAYFWPGSWRGFGANELINTAAAFFDYYYSELIGLKVKDKTVSAKSTFSPSHARTLLAEIVCPFYDLLYNFYKLFERKKRFSKNNEIFDNYKVD